MRLKINAGREFFDFAPRERVSLGDLLSFVEAEYPESFEPLVVR